MSRFNVKTMTVSYSCIPNNKPSFIYPTSKHPRLSVCKIGHKGIKHIEPAPHQMSDPDLKGMSFNCRLYEML